MQSEPERAHVMHDWAHSSPLISCRFDPQGRYVFACAEDRSVLRWELESGAKTVLRAHESWARGIGFSLDGQTLITSGYDDTLIWWTATADVPEPLRTVQAHDGWIRSVSVSPDGQLLASAGNDGAVRLWTIADGQLVAELAGHAKHVYSSCFHPSGERLMTGDLGGKILEWDVADGELLRTFDAEELYSRNQGQNVDFGGVRSLAFSPDAERLVASGLYNGSNPLGSVCNPRVLVFDWQSQEVVARYDAEPHGVAWRSVFHPDGYLVGACGGTGGGFLMFWRGEQEKEFHRFQLPNTARDLDLHPDALHVATAHHDGHLRVTGLQEPETFGERLLRRARHLQQAVEKALAERSSE